MEENKTAEYKKLENVYTKPNLTFKSINESVNLL